MKTYYFWILVINACKIALTSAVFCGINAGRNDVVKIVLSLGIIVLLPILPPIASGGLIIVTTSGSIVSSVEKTRVNWSSNDFRGSTFVGDKHVSNTDFDSTADKLNDCFFLLPGVLLEVRNRRLRFSLTGATVAVVVTSFSRGGLPVFCGSEFCASGSVLPAFPSLPELSFLPSGPRSIFEEKKKKLNITY